MFISFFFEKIEIILKRSDTKQSDTKRSDTKQSDKQQSNNKMPEPTTTRLQEWERISDKVESQKLSNSWIKFTDSEMRFMRATYSEEFDAIAVRILRQSHIHVSNLIKYMPELHRQTGTARILPRIKLTIDVYRCLLDSLKIDEFIKVFGTARRKRVLNAAIGRMGILKNETIEYVNNPNSDLTDIDYADIVEEFAILSKYAEREETLTEEYEGRM